jgi:hypothetical protein
MPALAKATEPEQDEPDHQNGSGLGNRGHCERGHVAGSAGDRSQPKTHQREKYRNDSPPPSEHSFHVWATRNGPFAGAREGPLVLARVGG